MLRVSGTCGVYKSGTNVCFPIIHSYFLAVPQYTMVEEPQLIVLLESN